MEQRISLVTLGVGDLARARRFYEDGLGWRAVGDNEGIAFYQLPAMVFALYPRAALAKDANLDPDAPAPGFSGVALAYNVREKDEADRVLAEASAAGALILKPAEDAFWGGYSGYFADPDGHAWEVAWNPHWTLDAAGGVRAA